MRMQTYYLVPFIVRTFENALNFILQDDNAPTQSAVVTEKKQELGLKTLRRPSRSPDMNPIAHVWSFISAVDRILLRLLYSFDKPFFQAWEQMPQSQLHRLILSMLRRISALLFERGGYTRY